MVDYRVSGLALALVLAACGGETPAPEASEPVQTPVATTSPATKPTAPATLEIATNPDKNAYFGDLHIHTSNSFDAFIFGTRTSPDDAYRFAKGETIAHNGGFEIKLEGPPLDFLAVTDHGEYMGVLPAMANPLMEINKTATAQSIFGKDAADGQKPNHSKDTPSQRPSNGDKGEGGVGTCDEEVDGGVVKDLKELFEAMAREAVVEGGGKVKEDHAGSKDDSRDHSPSVFGKKADEDKADDRGDDSKSVGDRGGEFFSRRITERGSGAGCCGELLHGEKGSL